MLGPIKIKHQHIALSDTTPVLALFDDGDEVYYSVSFSIQNIHESAIVYVGGTGLTSSSYGIKIAPGGKIDFSDMPRYPGIYALSSVDGSSIAVLRTSK